MASLRDMENALGYLERTLKYNLKMRGEFSDEGVSKQYEALALWYGIACNALREKIEKQKPVSASDQLIKDAIKLFERDTE